jgi:uncharacterized protein (DUF305 family)
MTHSITTPLGRGTLAVIMAGALTAAMACGGRNDAAGDSTGATTVGAAAATDTGMAGMAGMDHANMDMPAMNRSAPRDSNQVFLRMMSDHHQGLIVMSDSAHPRLQSETAHADATKLGQKQKSEQQQMLSMLSRQYQDSVTPTIMSSNRAMIDSVTRTPKGAEADRVYYRQVVAHHREGLQHTEMQLPHLTGEVKQMAERMRTEHQREIAEFERKASGGGAR